MKNNIKKKTQRKRKKVNAYNWRPLLSSSALQIQSPRNVQPTKIQNIHTYLNNLCLCHNYLITPTYVHYI